MSEPSKAVFLSYASQDAEAARRICDALRAAGVEVWFDQSELRGGDSWDQKIRRQIKECALFMPIVSANTQARREGYFRLEWKLAEDRTHLMAKGTPFLVPVCIDETKDWDALVPDSFMSVQWTRLPAGETPPAFTHRVSQLLSGGTTPPVAPRPPAPPQPAAARPERPRPGRGRWPLAFIALAAVAGAAVLIWRILPRPGGERPGPAMASAAAVFPVDPDLRRAHALVYGIDSIPEDFALADDIVKPKLAARPNDPETVIVAAEVAQEYVSRGFDTTQPRRALAQRLTERAVQLAPDNPDALGVLGRRLGNADTQFGRAEQLLRRAIELNPGEPRYYRSLYDTLFAAKSIAEADAFGRQMAARFPQDPLVAYDIGRRFKDANDLVNAEAWFDRSLAIRPLAFALIWKAWFALEAHADPAAMKRWLDQVPDRQRVNARVVFANYVHAIVTHDTAPAIQMLNGLADTWLTDFDFTGPKALLLGDLLQLEGHADLAHIQYEAALAEIQRMITHDPTDPRPRRAEFWVQFAVGHRDEARTALRISADAMPHPLRWNMRYSWWMGPIRGALLLGERSLALGLLREGATEPSSRFLLRQLLQIDPAMAPFRQDPEIVALVDEPTSAPGTAAPTHPSAPLSEGAQLAARALALITKVGFTRDDLGPAEDFARRATELEPDSAATWGVRAGVQAAWLFRGWDNSEKRRQDTQSFANHALALDPNEPEALLALGHVLRNQGAFDQAAEHLRRALAANPTHVRLGRALGYTLSGHGRDAEARAVLLEVVKRAPRDPLLHYELAMTYMSYASVGAPDENLTGALAQLDLAIAIQPFSSALILKAALIGGWRGDLPAMRAVLDQVDRLPLGERSEDRSVCIAMWASLLERRADRTEAAASLTARSYFDDSVMPMRPKAWSLALAHRVAGKENLARADWQAAEAVLRQRIKDDPANPTYQVELAVTLAWLDRGDEAARLVAPIEPVWKEDFKFGRAGLLATYYAGRGNAEKAAVYLAPEVDRLVFTSRKVLPLDPRWDKIRDQPAFEALLKVPPTTP